MTQTALAGSLKFEDLDALKRINPDIGVRGWSPEHRPATIRVELVEKAMKMLVLTYVIEK